MEINEKHIPKILTLSTFIVVGIIVLLSQCSCSTINKLESSHYHYYEDTKALIVVEKTGNKLLCKSPAGICYYYVTDKSNCFHPNDTIDLRDNKNTWVYQNTKFINRPERP